MPEFATFEQARSALFLSPHFDDVALSCGGTVALLSNRGLETLVVTVFGGDPPGELNLFARQQHRWRGLDDAAALTVRRQEERCAARELGTEAQWLDFPDAIYREDYYLSDEQLFGPLHPADEALVPVIETAIRRLLECLPPPTIVFVPLAIGHHVDHQLVQRVGARLAQRGTLVWAYEDLPYALTPAGTQQLSEFAAALSHGDARLVYLDESTFERRLRSIACYRSQIAFLFRELGDPVRELRTHALRVGSGRLAERFWPLRS